MPKLSERGAAHLLVPLILLIGIIAAVYLVVSGNLKLFSKASNPPIVFKSSTGQVLTNNSSGIPQTNSPSVKIELTSTLGAPAGGVSAPVGSATKSVKLAENPTDLEKSSAPFPYLSEPMVIDYTFKDATPGAKFIWVEFKDVSGKVDRQSAQIEITNASGSQCNLCAADVNKDGGVNAFDVSALKSCYNKSATSNGSDGKPCIDKDAFKDGWINGKDLSCIGTYMMQDAKSCQATPTPLSYNRVFVSSVLYNGNLGGLSGADAKCQERANAANLGGNWKAWLSDNSNSASYRLYHSNVPYKTISNQIIADNWNDLTDGYLKNSGSMTIDEFGRNNGSSSWTNTTPDGSIKSTSGSCINWTSDSRAISGNQGNNLYIDKEWTEGLSTGCNQSSRLYCFEQPVGFVAPSPNPSFIPTPTPAPTPTPTPSPKHVFVTSTTYNGNLGGLSGADAKCQERANAANLGGNWKAWLSDSNNSARARLSHSPGEYYLLDGRRLAWDWTGIVSSAPGSLSINVTELRTTQSGYAWTNTKPDGTIEGSNGQYNNCNNWSSTYNSSGNKGRVGSYYIQWTSDNAIMCTVENSLYCFEQ